MNTLAVIGSAGRKDDVRLVSAATYDGMYAQAAAAVREWEIGQAVSGGAAFADHLAVRLFLEGAVRSLVLFLPAAFDGRAYVPDASVRFNPGQTSNGYHRAFSEACGLDSLSEIAEAADRGAVLRVVPGFHMRNSEVADACTHMIAMTSGGGGGEAVRDFTPSDPGFADARAAGLRDGGTAHTWGECWKAVRKRHVSIGHVAAGRLVP